MSAKPPGGLMSADYLRHALDLSDLDRGIIEVLQRDGRRPFSHLARDVGVTEKTARRRTHALLDAGVIHITAITDPRTLGYRSAALAGITLDGSGAAGDVAAALTRIDALDYVVVSAGRYAVFAELFCRDLADLREVVDRRIRTTPGIAGVELFPYLSLHYQQADLTMTRRPPAERRRGVRAVDVDALDRQIIWELSRDGRIAHQAIADALGISEAQVRGRLKRLIDEEAVQVIAIVNPLRYGYGTMAWVAVTAQPAARLQAVAEELTRLPYVTYVAICTGSVDVFAEVVCASEQELLELLDGELRRLPGAERLEVFLYLDLHYKRLRPLPDADRRTP